MGLVLCGPAALRASAESPGYPGIYFAADVEQQFASLARRGDGLAFNLGAIDAESDPSLCKHMQGLARLAGTGTPYLIVSRSGNDPSALCITGFEDDSPGNLFVVRMGSRDTTGERMRSNRLRRDWTDQYLSPIGPLPWTKPPDTRDRLVNNVKLSGIWPSYMHPGGMQLVDDVLAVAFEAPFGSGPSRPSPDNMVLFVDVSNPEAPQPLSQFPAPGSTLDFGKAGLAGITPVINPAGPGLRYLMITTGGANEDVRLWRSLSTAATPNGPSDLRSPDLDWEELGRWTDGQLGATQCSGDLGWPTGSDSHQSLNFLRQDSLAGPLYLVGGRNDGIGGDGSDYLTLYRMNVDIHGNPSNGCPMSVVQARHVTSYPFGGHGDSAALSAAGGAYVSPSGELIVYGMEYENDGPWEYLGPNQPGTRTVRFVEWRNLHVVRPDSPTLRPSVQTAPSVAVDEGSTAALTGVGRGPITKAWIQLFEDDGAGGTLEFDDDDWLQVDYDDWSRDHFDSFVRLDDTTGTDYDDNAGSWRWFAPDGCTMRVNEDPVGATTGAFPGRHTRTLHGEGQVKQKNDLDEVDNDAADAKMDDKISSVQFDEIAPYPWDHPRCADYYSASIGVSWDLDGDGAFETSGSEPSFSAAALDGPSQAVVSARGQHPTDASDLGHGVPVSVTVDIRNVSPVLTGMELRDSLGNLVGSTVPFVLTGLPVTARASFTDAGRPDRQTATLDWGDGGTDSSTQFDSFSDAFGGVVGALEHAHSYAAGGEQTVLLSVTDDDNGMTTGEHAVRVVTPEQALAEIGAILEALIASTTNHQVRKDLEAAQKALVGNPQGSQNGALNKVRGGQVSAADSFLRKAIDRLMQAQAGGANVGALVSLVQQIRTAVAAG